MSKSYLQKAEKMSIFLSPVVADVENDKKNERAGTKPLREARFIDIKKIEPDPNQPRKKFVKKSIESLAESIRELNGIIDPLTVQWDEAEHFFRIINGERRYRAAKIANLETLPCIIKEVGEKKRLLLQMVTNLQRENISALEECDGIRSLINKYGYSQAMMAKLLNKSKSYISQILGLERLTPIAREIVQTSELQKEVQIQASREKEPRKQAEILRKAAIDGKTVKEIRLITNLSKPDNTHKSHDNNESDNLTDENPLQSKRFRKWTWRPKDGRFVVTLEFRKKQSNNEKLPIIKNSLEEIRRHVMGLTH